MFYKRLREKIAEHAAVTKELIRAHDENTHAISRHDTRVDEQITELRALLAEVEKVVNRVSGHGAALQAIHAEGLESVKEGVREALLSTLTSHRRTCGTCKRMVHRFRTIAGCVQCEDCEVRESRV